MKEIAKASQGFVYLVSITGVTGVKDTMETRVKDLVKMLQSVTDKPVGASLLPGISCVHIWCHILKPVSEWVHVCRLLFLWLLFQFLEG